MANNFSRAVQQVRERRKVGQADAYRELHPARSTRQNPTQYPASAANPARPVSSASQESLLPATELDTSATSGPAVLPTSSGIEQPEISAAQQESENKPTFASALLGIMGRGDTALTAEEGRALRESGEQAAEANRAPETVNWQGRDDLLKEYRRLRAAYDPANPEGEVNDRMREVLRQLREGDEAAGNEARDYTWGDRATSVISGAAQNIGSSLANAASTVGQSYGRTAMMEQAGNVDQALRDIRFGENTSENIRAAMEAADEGNRAWEGLTATADRLGAAAAEDLERAKGGLSGLGRAGVDIAENVLEMGFDAAVGTVTGGGSLGSMFLRTLGSGAAEARNAGAGLDEQILYGTVKGGIETLTEKMFDGVAHIYGKGAADDIVENAIRKLADTNTGKTFLRVLSNAGGEGVEELVSGLLEPVAQYIYKGEVGDIDPAELLYGVLMGAAIGALGGATSIATGQNANANARLQAMDTVEPNVNAIMSDPARLAEYAQQYQADTGEALPTGRGARNAIMQHEADALLAAQSGQQANAQPETAPVQEAAPQTEAPQTEAQQEVDPAVQTVRDMLAQPVNRSQANRIINDPALRAAYEAETGTQLPAVKSEAARAVMEYSQQAAEAQAAQTEQAAPEMQQEVAPVEEQAPAQETQPMTPLAQTLMGGQESTAPVQNEATQAPPVNLPPSNNQPGTRESQTAESLRNAPNVPDEFRNLIDQARENGGFRYAPISNDTATQNAMAHITQDGWTDAFVNWRNDVNKGKAGADMTATGALLFNHALEVNDFQLAMDVASTFAALGTNTGQGLQMFKVIKAGMSPANQMAMMDKACDLLNKKFGLDNVHVPENLRSDFVNAPTEEARNAVVDQIKNELVKQIPTRAITFENGKPKINWQILSAKWTALRYMNMLGNFKTQIRNIIGNTAMSATVSAKNAVQFGVERLARALGRQNELTTSLVADRALVQEARADYNENADFINGEGKYSDSQLPAGLARDVQDERRVFSSNILEWIRKATNFAMERGDTVFISARYARALAGYLQANGMDAETFAGIRNGTIEATPEQSALLDRARSYATQEAQEATFHDSNALSNLVSQIGRGPNSTTASRVISEGIMPFRKTPANILVRAEEYSPLGIVNTAVKAVQAKSGKVDGTEVINQLAKTLTGSGLFALGMFLRNIGALVGHEDDDKQEGFDKLRGGQDYALVLPDGTSITLDWLAPSSVPLFMGVQLMDGIVDGGFQASDLMQAFTTVTDPMIQMSMLQGVNDTINDLRYADNNLGQLAINAAISYLTQGLSNTLLGQAERTAEDRRYSTYLDGGNQFSKAMQRQLGKWSAKTPGYDFNQVEYIDAWGRPDYNGSFGTRLFNNFFNPSYVSQDNSTEVDNELQRLYNAGQSNVFPQRIPMSYEVSQYDADGNRTGSRPLTQDEYGTFQRIAGQTSLEMVKDLMQSPAYASMSDEARGKAISEIYSYARNIAAQAVEPSTKKEYEAISTLSNPAAFIGIRAAYNSLTSSDTARDYDAIDRLMNNYASMPQDVRDLLEDKVSGLRKLAEAHRAGVDSAAFFAQQDRIGDLKPAEGNTRVVTWQRVADIADNRELSDNQRDAMLRQEFTEGALKKYDECRNRGYSPTQIANFYRIYNTAGKKADIIAQAISSGFSRPQAVALYSMWHNGRWS